MSNFLKAAGAVVGLSLALIVIFTARPLTVIPPDPDPTHPFQTERAFERLVRILGDETPHPVDSDANDAVRERLVGEIEALGFSPIVRDDFHCPVKPGLGACARVRNVLFWATAPGPNAVMLASHYDSVPPGPGAADDGAGVAISLEIAALMKGRALERPLLVLITDGEETGLIGASSFVNTDPLAKLVTAVVSMEARGVRGLASMFQTGRPNGRDTAFLKRPSTRIAKTSSLDTDVYELLPNDTDLTQYLNLPIDAANFAFVGGAAFYHTPHDDLAHLDKRSLFHMGANALAATETFLEQSGDEEDSQKIYVDVMGATVLMMPQAWGVPVLGLGLVIFAITFLRAEGAPFRAAVFPPLSVLLGLGFAIGVSLAVGAVRPETQFGAAHPWALRAAQNAAGLFGAALVFLFLYRSEAQTRFFYSGFFWFAAVGLALALALPGGAIIFAPFVMLLIVATALTMMKQMTAMKIVLAIAALLFLLVMVPLTAVGETSLFVERAAPFVIAPLFLFIFLAPLAAPSLASFAGVQKPAGFLLAAPVAAAVGFALLVPAYSADAPRGLSILHYKGDGMERALWAISRREPAPAAMRAAAAFEAGEAPGLPGERWVASAPDFDHAGLRVEILSDTIENGERIVVAAIAAPDADRLFMTFGDKDEAARAVSSLALNGQTIAFSEADSRQFACYGRACRAFEMTVVLKAEAPAPELALFAARHGLGPESADLANARPNWALPQHWGDLRVVSAPLPLAANEAAAGGDQ